MKYTCPLCPGKPEVGSFQDLLDHLRDTHGVREQALAKFEAFMFGVIEHTKTSKEVLSANLR